MKRLKFVIRFIAGFQANKSKYNCYLKSWVIYLLKVQVSRKRNYFVFKKIKYFEINERYLHVCLLYTSPSPRDKRQYRMPSSA